MEWHSDGLRQRTARANQNRRHRAARQARGDLLDMFPVRVKQCETILDGYEKGPPLPVAHTGPSPIAA